MKTPVWDRFIRDLIPDDHARERLSQSLNESFAGDSAIPPTMNGTLPSVSILITGNLLPDAFLQELADMIRESLGENLDVGGKR